MAGRVAVSGRVATSARVATVGRGAASGRLNQGFVPPNYSGNVLWLRGDLGASPAAWNDQSGFGNNGTQGTPANQAVLLATGAPNNLPAFQFTAASSQFFALPNAFTALTAGELYIVTRSDATVVAPCGFSEPSGGLQMLYPYSDGHIYDNFGSDSRYDTGAAITPVSNWCVYNVTSQLNAWSSRLNGKNQYFRFSNNVAFAATPYIGRSITIYFTGLVAEVVVYSRVLATAERKQVTRYLGDRYNISVSASDSDLAA